MGVGGIQKALLNLLRGLDGDNYSVDLYLFSREDFFNAEYPENVTVRYLPPAPGYCKYIPFDAAFSRLSAKYQEMIPTDVCYDVAADFNSYQPECAACALMVPAAKRVEWVHNDIEIKLKNEWKYRVLHTFFKDKYKYFDEFVCVSAGLKEPFIKCAGTLSDDVSFRVINNPIDAAEVAGKISADIPADAVDESKVNLVTVGRLCHQKGYDIMLREFAAAAALRREKGLPDDLVLYIIGGGPEADRLASLSSQLGLDGKVVFTGNVSNPFPYMKRMDGFVSTSRYEGQPVNIMEAMAVGLPLYCSKNLEKYVEGLTGYEDLAGKLSTAGKAERHPANLEAYNRKIFEEIGKLCRES